jgi:ATP-dependent Clp protease ATP-binding subunit ClpB
MTSNVGSEIYAQDQAGFLPKEKFSPEWLQEKRTSVDKALRAKFKPPREIDFHDLGSSSLDRVLSHGVNRVDRVIHFNPLTRPDLERIFDLQFESVKQRLLDSRKVHLTITPPAIEHVCAAGYDVLNGARPLARAIDRLIVEPLTDMVLEGKIKADDKVSIDFDGLRLTFN